MKKSYPLNLLLDFDETDFLGLKDAIRNTVKECLIDNYPIWHYVDEEVKDELIDQILCDVAKYLINS